MTNDPSNAQGGNGKKDPLPTTRDKAPPGSPYSGGIATLEVGRGVKKQIFYAHRELLSFYSGYFKASLNGDFAEAQSEVIKLDAEDPEVFEDFVHWLYTHKTHRSEINGGNRSKVSRAFAALGIFADLRDIPLLMNEVIDSWKEAISEAWCLPIGQITMIYDETHEQSPLRRFTTYVIAATAGSIFTDRYASSWPKEALWDLLKVLLSDPRPTKLSKDQFQEFDTCSFHIHEEGARCSVKAVKR